MAIETATTLPPKLASLMRRTNTTHIKDLLKNTRRIINGIESEGKPYMVSIISWSRVRICSLKTFIASKQNKSIVEPEGH